MLSAAALGAVYALSGCSHAAPAAGGGTTPGTPSAANLSGNWEFRATPAQGTSAPFTVLSGFLSEQGSGSALNFTTASLATQSSTCFSTTPTLSLEGSVQGTQVGLLSFSAAGQIVTINGTADATAANISSTYSVAGGCGDGDHGQLQGVFYSPLNGNYNGPVTGASQLSGMHLTLMQSGGTGDGLFFVTGSATFSGSSCFSKGTLAYTSSSVSGSTFHLRVTTDEASASQVTMIGTLNPAANTLTISSIAVVGGGCAGPAGIATLGS